MSEVDSSVQNEKEEAVRRQKLEELIAAGENPYEITKFKPDHYSAEVTEGFAALEGKTVTVAGRMISKRVMGKASFAHILDTKGSLQIYVQREMLGDEAYAKFKKLDTGDIIGVCGEVFKTHMGEVSVKVHTLTLLTKSLKPLPEKMARPFRHRDPLPPALPRPHHKPRGPQRI